MGVSSARSSKVQLGHGITSCALHWYSSLLLSLTGTTLCLTYHQYTNTTHKLHWHAWTRIHVHAPVLPYAFTRWCGCAMGTSTGPKQAVAHVFMPVMSVGIQVIAPKMGMQGCREDGVLEAPGPYW